MCIFNNRTKKTLPKPSSCHRAPNTTLYPRTYNIAVRQKNIMFDSATQDISAQQAQIQCESSSIITQGLEDAESRKYYYSQSIV